MTNNHQPSPDEVDPKTVTTEIAKGYIKAFRVKHQFSAIEEKAILDFAEWLDVFMRGE